MPAHKTPRWTPAEIAVLREHYPTGGFAAVQRILPERSWHAIHVKAHKLGITTNFRNRAPSLRLEKEALEEAITLREREGWSFAKIGSHFGIAEAAACNAIIMAQCVRKGYTPAQRDQFGRLTAEGRERLRYALKKGMKGIDIQLRLGVSAACVAEQRRQYNRDLAARGKAPLPPAGAGLRYSGARISKESRKAAEALFLEGYGTQKVSQRSGVSKTVCTRIRAKLVKRLARKGESLPGCDLKGRRHTVAEATSFITDEQKQEFRRLILDRVPVARAAAMVAIGQCSAKRLRDDLAAELAGRGEILPAPVLPGRVRVGLFQEADWPPRGQRELNAFRVLLQTMPLSEAKDHWRANKREERKQQKLAEASRPKSFEDQLAAVAAGKVRLVSSFNRHHLEPKAVRNDSADHGAAA